MGLMTVKTNTRLMFFIIWNTLKENDIKIPYPHRVVEFKNMLDIPEE
jgi:small-conductance mechanosensitive channel